MALWPVAILTRLDRDDPRRQRLEWVRRHAHDHGLAYAFDVHDGKRGWATRPGLRDEKVFGDKRLSTNSRGLRDATEHAYARTPGKARFILFGDSFTFGDEVSNDETYSHYLGELMPDAEVLNFGVHGYGHDQMLLYLKEEGVRYRPDVIILGYVWFDRYRSLHDFTNFSKPAFDLTDAGLRLTNVPVPTPEQVLASELYRSRLLDVVLMVVEKARKLSGATERRAQALQSAILEEMVRVAGSHGAVPVLVYLPVLAELLDASPELSSNERAFDLFCRERNLRCLFLRQHVVSAIPRGKTIDTTRHWPAFVHRIAAQGIRDYLVREGLGTPMPVKSVP